MQDDPASKNDVDDDRATASKPRLTNLTGLTALTGLLALTGAACFTGLILTGLTVLTGLSALAGLTALTGLTALAPPTHLRGEVLEESPTTFLPPDTCTPVADKEITGG